jgi:hypothetical protein
MRSSRSRGFPATAQGARCGPGRRGVVRLIHQRVPGGFTRWSVVFL